jgi:hypothetical protein
VQPTIQTGPFQRVLDGLNGARAPGVFLLPVVDGQERLLDEGGDPGPQVGLGLHHFALRHPSLEQGLDNLGPVPLRLGLGDPAQVVPVGPEPTLYDHGPESGRELELDQRYDGQLVLADAVLRLWLGKSDGPPDHLQKHQGDACAFAQFTEGRATDSGELIKGAGIQEGERERSAPDGSGHAVERHPGPLQASYPTGPAHVTRRERVAGGRPQDPELDQSIDIVRVDPGPLRHLLAGVLGHGTVIVDGVMIL